MPGTKTSGRPGGNPDFGTKYGFKKKETEPLSETLNLRVSPTMMNQLKTIQNWRDMVREIIAEELERRSLREQESDAKLD